MKKRSMAVAVLLWFFFGFLAAHKFYLGRTREGLRLILLYFFAPLIMVIAVIFGMRLFGITLLPPDVRPEDILALAQDAKFLFLAGIVFLVLAGIWLWDLKNLIWQVRAHNARAAGEIPGTRQEETEHTP